MQQEAYKQVANTRYRWYIISFNNSYKFYWQIFVILLAIYNAIALPCEIAFAEVQEFYDTHTVLEVWEILVDCFFIMDMLIMFASSYVEKSSGETIRSPKKIAKNYIAGAFVVDFISSLPLFLRFIINSTTQEDSDLNKNLTLGVTLLRLLKLLRVRRLSTLIANLNQPIETKSQLKRAYVIFLLVLICHI